ncbi:hypothetical protein TNCT_247401 [Trichonephila clavata]|uniref:Uncharacterized protein n=1 Tax=Trichonephila clavata TaxID=2740835 RepID=A0A8X6J589_TRICU|nr:hypothetical protein TNCT_247401 [Trichonephila clavata]
MHSISSKYRKPKGRPNKRRAACIRNLEKGKSACSSSSDSKCDAISTGAVPSTSVWLQVYDSKLPSSFKGEGFLLLTLAKSFDLILSEKAIQVSKDLAPRFSLTFFSKKDEEENFYELFHQ